MKIIIDIPERLYEHIQNGLPNYLFVERLIEGVKEGTPLPKGHGRLIDEKEMLKRLDDWNWKDVIEKSLCNFVLNRIIESPTIIEADKEVKE